MESASYGQIQSAAKRINIAVQTVQDDLLNQLRALPPDALQEELSRWEQQNPLVRNVFIWRDANDLALPNTSLPLTGEEQDFLQRYQTLFNGSRAWQEANGREEMPSSISRRPFSRKGFKQNTTQGGWIPWYWENQLGMIGWVQKETSGFRYGIELEMIALFSELLPGNLGDVPNDQALALVDSNGKTIYQSGDLDTSQGLEPALRTPVGQTLPHWEIVLYTPTGTFGLPTQVFALLAGLLIIILFISLFTAGVLLLREAYRSRRDAHQKTTFVSNVSHELKTPLTTIRMYADLLSEGRVKDPEKSTSYLQTITSESRRLTRLVNNVLDFSRLEQNRKKYQIQRFDLREALTETIQSQRIRIHEASMALHVSLPETPAPIETDRDAIQQVILNIIDNAIKYAADGKELSINLTSSSAKHFISIADAGQGISKKHRERIFERFFRIDDSITAKSQGCGLGLGIARRLLSDLGASLEYKPSRDTGACFIIALPSESEAT